MSWLIPDSIKGGGGSSAEDQVRKECDRKMQAVAKCLQDKAEENVDLWAS